MKNIKIEKALSISLSWLIVFVITYLFLSLCNWDLNLKDWTGFSRFILAAEGILYLINLWDRI
jgi:hypothetical protein